MSNEEKEKIKALLRREKLTLKKLIEKYPHLTEAYLEDILAQNDLREDKDKTKKLLLD
tara:strand:- start:286 stop:459 length:174 start_codon:yes stop_codon:yes gene_type:complete